ncbi:hypothetical protein B0H16DRAFT_1892959 [Mycena metata]|uniref:Uncharacterized protein n=1 Tax=Mycena metata TaxID=1033252 RepID=A0AAD7I2W9_9AGAR|nr:hypothetical protein B0H16DRAFT_1892959 [Mycena metata]
MSDAPDDDLSHADSQYTGNHDDNPGWLPESEYNDGKGIRYVISLLPIPPPLKTGEKHRKNKKIETINRTIYAHEQDSLADVLQLAIDSVGYQNKLLFKVVSKDLRATNFTVTWSISRTDFKRMQLANTDHFDEIVEEAVKKASPTVKLDFLEFEVDEDKDESDEEPVGTSKKRKLTDEEERMAETVSQLKAAYNCSDKRCTSPICYLGNPDGEHVRMTPILLNTWAAANLAGICDLEHPPPGDKRFQPVKGRDDIDDIALEHIRTALQILAITLRFWRTKLID